TPPFRWLKSSPAHGPTSTPPSRRRWRTSASVVPRCRSPSTSSSSALRARSRRRNDWSGPGRNQRIPAPTLIGAGTPLGEPVGLPLPLDVVHRSGGPDGRSDARLAVLLLHGLRAAKRAVLDRHRKLRAHVHRGPPVLGIVGCHAPIRADRGAAAAG